MGTMLHQRRRRKALALTAVCVSTVGAALALNAWVVKRAAPFVLSLQDARVQAPKDAVVVVLGASVRANGKPSRVLADRLATALDVAGNTHKILLTGDGLSAKEIVGMRAWLVDRGVAADRLLEDPAGLRTWDSMLRAKDVFHLTNVVVVTNAFHIDRAVYLAKAAGLNAICVAAPPRAKPPRFRNHVRESVARVRAVVDVTLNMTAAHPTGYGPKVKPAFDRG